MPKHKHRGKCDWLWDLDMFGFPVSLYYQNKENVKKSLCGSIITIIIMIISLSYVAELLNHVMNPVFQNIA